MPSAKKVRVIRVTLDLRDFTVSVDEPEAAAPGVDVVWVFGSKNGKHAAKKFLPPGWVPMVSFSTPDETGGTDYTGPFESFVLSLKDTKKERGRFELRGEWGGNTESDGPPVYEYKVFLHRDLGGDDAENFGLLSSSNQILEVEGRAAAFVSEKRSTIHVARAERLIVAEELRKIDTKTTIEWDFRRVDLEGFFPLVLFYEYRDPVEPDRAGSRGKKRIHFGPFQQMRFQGKTVSGSEVIEKKGFYHYETALFSIRDRSVRFFNSGDPRIDNEGDPGTRKK